MRTLHASSYRTLCPKGASTTVASSEVALTLAIAFALTLALTFLVLHANGERKTVRILHGAFAFCSIYLAQFGH